MTASKRVDMPIPISRLVETMERIAPTRLAQEWDNVGLLAGDPRARLRRVLLCIDLAPAVVEEAISEKVDLVLAYHPPIFKPISRLRADAWGAESQVFQCIAHGISIYATHTALDAADGGTNDVIALLCGAEEVEPLVHGEALAQASVKLVVFVPPKNADRVAEAMFAAGSGRIGDYSHCSFRIPGKGTFLGSQTTNPARGKRGRRETVDELRLETIVPRPSLPAVVHALIKTHPYEEPAFDLYPLLERPVGGIGRIGRLRRAVPLATLAGKLKKAVHAPSVQRVGPEDRPIDRVVIVVGAAGRLPLAAPLTPNHAIITGEIRHHDALTIERIGCTAIALGHWSSERPVLDSLAVRLRQALPTVQMAVSQADREPFRPV